MTQNRIHKGFSVGYAIEKKDWNVKRSEVRTSHPLSVIINAAIQSKRKGVVQKSEVSMIQLYRKAKGELVGESFIDYYVKRNISTSNSGTSIK